MYKIFFYYVGRDYITFLDLDDKTESDSATSTEGNVSPDELGQDTSDYYSSPVFIDNGIPIGAAGTLSTQLYVSIAIGTLLRKAE